MILAEKLNQCAGLRHGIGNELVKASGARSQSKLLLSQSLPAELV
jgi:hypothetical protein